MIISIIVAAVTSIIACWLGTRIYQEDKKGHLRREYCSSFEIFHAMVLSMIMIAVAIATTVRSIEYDTLVVMILLAIYVVSALWHYVVMELFALMKCGVVMKNSIAGNTSSQKSRSL